MGKSLFFRCNVIWWFYFIIQEVQLSTLSNKDCATFGKAMKAIPRIELCAGNKIYLQPLPRYVKYANGTLAKDLLPMQNDITSETFYLGKCNDNDYFGEKGQNIFNKDKYPFQTMTSQMLELESSI